MEDLQTLHIPTNKETRGLDTIQATSFLGGYFPSFKNSFRQREICIKKTEIRKNPEKSLACFKQNKLKMQVHVHVHVLLDVHVHVVTSKGNQQRTHNAAINCQEKI